VPTALRVMRPRARRSHSDSAAGEVCAAVVASHNTSVDDATNVLYRAE
jgi:hypothetical protein